MPTNPEPGPRPDAAPEIEPARGSPPKRFPDHPTPLSGDQLDPATKSAQGTPEGPGTPTRQGPGGDSDRIGGGEDPDVESGTDKNDPEQQAGDDSVEKSFE